ncbi:MAG: hypothetical protein HYT79_00815 [Elusimicrobia bacterium]|nr:hypothetical protein [Elusimicrobiota bacterium]
MALLILLIVVALFVIAVAVAASDNAKRRPKPSLEIRVESGGSDGGKVNTGPVTQTSDGGWIINPQSTFPLTLQGIERETAGKIKDLLADDGGQNPYRHRLELERIVARSNLRCKEIDEYTNKFRPAYLQKIEELKKASPEWQTASGKDKEDLLFEFRQQAASTLEVVPHSGVEILFESEPEDAALDDQLIDKYGYDNIQVYMRCATKLDKVWVMPAEHRDRKEFEALAASGLALRGEQIPTDSILEVLSLKDLNRLAAPLSQSEFKRKAKAIEVLAKAPDLTKRLGEVIAFRELFKLQPLPPEFASIELTKVAKAWEYAGEIASLIEHTYSMGKYSLAHISGFSDASSFIRGWELSAIGDDRTCSHCKRVAAKKFSKQNYPKTPLHIGCRCTVLPVTKYE